jgi:RND family efflux transporter MFP subunit
MTSIVHLVHLRAFLLTAGLLGAAAPIAGCQQSKQNSLPPASGDKAPPAPKIPALTDLARQAPGEPAQGGADRAGTGSLRPVHEAQLGPKETGVITAIAVDEGDRVKKGQLLFKLDAEQAQLAVAQARAAQSAAQVQLDAAKLDFDRTQALRARGSIAEDSLDQARSRFDAARSAYEQAQAALGLAQRHANNMVVQSPIDGIVTEKRMNVGETATMMPPSIVLVVQEIDQLELRARLPETALMHVREQSELTVTFPAVGETRKVRVQRIAPTIDARTRTIEIVAAVDNQDHRLKAGMLAEVTYRGQTAGEAEAEAEAEASKGAAAQQAGGDRQAGAEPAPSARAERTRPAAAKKAGSATP